MGLRCAVNVPFSVRTPHAEADAVLPQVTKEPRHRLATSSWSSSTCTVGVWENVLCPCRARRVVRSCTRDMSLPCRVVLRICMLVRSFGFGHHSPKLLKCYWAVFFWYRPVWPCSRTSKRRPPEHVLQQFQRRPLHAHPCGACAWCSRAQHRRLLLKGKWLDICVSLFASMIRDCNFESAASLALGGTLHLSESVLVWQRPLLAGPRLDCHPVYVHGLFARQASGPVKPPGAPVVPVSGAPHSASHCRMHVVSCPTCRGGRSSHSACLGPGVTQSTWATSLAPMHAPSRIHRPVIQKPVATQPPVHVTNLV